MYVTYIFDHLCIDYMRKYVYNQDKFQDKFLLFNI